MLTELRFHASLDARCHFGEVLFSQSLGQFSAEETKPNITKPHHTRKQSDLS